MAEVLSLCFISISGITSAVSGNVLVIVESSILDRDKDFTPSVTVAFQFSEVRRCGVSA